MPGRRPFCGAAPRRYPGLLPGLRSNTGGRVVLHVNLAVILRTGVPKHSVQRKRMRNEFRRNLSAGLHDVECARRTRIAAGMFSMSGIFEHAVSKVCLSAKSGENPPPQYPT